MSPYPASASATNYLSCYTQSSSALPNSVNCNHTSQSSQDVSHPQSHAYAVASNNTHTNANANATSTSSQLSTSTLATAGYTNTSQVMWTQFLDTFNQAPNINGFPSTVLYQFLLSPGMGMGMYPPQASSSTSASSSTMPIPQVRMTSPITSSVLENGKSSSVLNSSPTSTASTSCAPVSGNVSLTALTSPISPPESTNHLNVVLTQLSAASTPTEVVPAENVACVDEAI